MVRLIEGEIMKFLKNMRLFLVIIAALGPVCAQGMSVSLPIDERLRRIKTQVQEVGRLNQLPIHQRLGVLAGIQADYRKIVQDITGFRDFAFQYGACCGELAQEISDLKDALEIQQRVDEEAKQEAEAKQQLAELQEQSDREAAMLVARRDVAMPAAHADQDEELNLALAISEAEAHQGGQVLLPAVPVYPALVPAPHVLAHQPAPQAGRFNGEAQRLDQEPARAAQAPRVIPVAQPVVVPASPTNWFKRHFNWQRMVVVATLAAVATWWFLKK